ncbi:hypothetical protein BGZ67_005349 [Mortierella alpina]|nr:hypothetical protein BGZ67_005349 [Mortierella alpina]
MLPVSVVNPTQFLGTAVHVTSVVAAGRITLRAAVMASKAPTVAKTAEKSKLNGAGSAAAADQVDDADDEIAVPVGSDDEVETNCVTEALDCEGLEEDEDDKVDLEAEVNELEDALEGVVDDTPGEEVEEVEDDAYRYEDVDDDADADMVGEAD